MSVLPDDQMNSVINCETKNNSTWENLILYHEGPYDVKENRVMDLKLCYNTFRFKEGENLTQTFTRYKALMNKLLNDGIKLSKLEIILVHQWVTKEAAKFLPKSHKCYPYSLDDEEDTRSSQEYMNDLEIKFHERALLAKSKRPIKDFEAKYNKVKARQAFLSSGASTSKSTQGKFGLVKSMLNSSIRLFSFQFSSTEGLNSMLKNGPWFIRNHPHILRKWNPNVDLLKKDVGNVPVWVKLHGVPVTAFSEDGLSAIATKLGTPLMLDSYTSDMCLQSWGRSSYARVMIELRADVELKDTIVEGCPKNIGLGVAKNFKKPSQTSRGVSVGLKVGFKPHKEYRPVPKKPTASSSGNKKIGVEPTNEDSNSNSFNVLNLVDNDVELGTNGGRQTNLLIIEFEDLLISGQAILVDEAGNPLKNVECPGDYDSEDEVESVDKDMALSMAFERVSFGTQSLLKQWRDSYGNGDYDEDPYDDDMYEGQDLSQEIQAICDNLDIRRCGTQPHPFYLNVFWRNKIYRRNPYPKKTYEWDEEEVSSDDNEMVEVKVLMALADDESGVVGKESARNGEWVKISMRKVHTLLEIEDNDERKYFLDYLCDDLNFEQYPNQKRKILGVDQLTEDTSSSGQKDLVFVKSSADDTNVSKLNVERPWFSEAEGLILPNHDTGRILPSESQVNVTDSLITDYNSFMESTSVCNTLLPSLEKLLGAEPQTESHPGPKIIKSILKACSTRKSKTSKDVVINETNNSSAPAKGNKNVSASKRNSAPAGKLKNVKTEDDIPIHLSENCYKVLFYKQYERTDHRTCDLAEYIRSMNMVQHLKTQGESSSRSQSFKPLKPFPPCKHCRFNDHQSDDCHNYPICELCGSYDHDTKGHNRIISLRRGIKPRNPQFVTNSCETCGSTVHTTTDHNDIEWFRRGEAKKVESLNANRSKTLTKRWVTKIN
ncbi:retrovirus-related pol polyprotein from transposon TNT 1-94 [Tanacetum coccineum]|uniref:Retrovirus-related pol polyprotein from transposon TNT 1-94 n=1 Tax=Tanacetum coccineum TaxID=301880 RepID=A0ABQ4WQ39_9ASTR